MKHFLLLFSFCAFIIFTAHISTPENRSYSNMVNRIASQRDSIHRLYKAADSLRKKEIISSTQDFLAHTLYKRIIPYWLGTKWEFYGKTQIPRDSSIACGYFVVRTLEHLGVQLNPADQFAEDYSAYMVNSIADTSYKVYQYTDLLKIVKSKPDDIWIVGLRNHSGFLIKYQNKVRFVHSNYMYPTCVMDEDAEEAMVFTNSNIYVAGNIFKNNSLTLKWIMGESIPHTKKY